MSEDLKRSPELGQHERKNKVDYFRNLFGKKQQNSPNNGLDIEKLKANGDVDGLINALKVEDWGVCRDVVKILGEIGDPRASEPLIAIFDEEKPNSSIPPAFAKREIIGVLGTFAIHDHSVIQALITILKDCGYSYQDSAEDALVKVGNPAVQPLIASIEKSSEQGLRRVAQVLGKIGDKRAVEPLLPVLKNPEWGVRLWTAWALGEFKDESAVEHLIPLLKDEKAKVRESAEKALQQIGGEIANKALAEQPPKPEPVIIVGMTADEVIHLIGEPRDEGVSGAEILEKKTTDSRINNEFLYFEKGPNFEYSINFSGGKVVSVKAYPK